MTEYRSDHVDMVGSWMRARIAVAATGLLAAACGGGGGGSEGGSPPPPPQPPTITLTADATGAIAGDKPVALHVTVSDSSVPQWSLKGPGQLIAGTNGASMDYAPPDSESLDSEADVTITVSAGSSLQTLTLAIAPSMLPGHVWTLTKAEAPDWLTVQSGAGGFVASAAGGELWQSADGMTWTPRDPASSTGLRSINWNGTQWLGMDGAGGVVTSPDGSTWTAAAQATPGGAPVNLAWGNGTYVLADNGFNELFQNLVSRDGVTWSMDVAGPAPTAVAFGQGRFVGLSPNGVETSTDGLDWTPVTGSPAALSEIAFGNGVFVAATDLAPSGLARISGIATSPDGLVWTVTPTTNSMWVSATGLSFAHGLFFLQGNSGTYTSADGQTWSFVPQASGAIGFSGVAWSGGTYVGVSWLGRIATSTDGVSWSDVVDESPGNLLAIDASGGVMVATSDRGYLLRSTDGEHWTRAPIGNPPASTIAASALAYGNGVHVAVGGSAPTNLGGIHDGMIYASYDAVLWTPAQVSSPHQAFVSVVFDGQRFVALNVNGGVYASTDGLTWSSLSSVPGGKVWTNAIGYGGGHYVVVANGFIATSSDAVNWASSVAAAIQPSLGETAESYNAIAYDGTRFVAVGNWGATAISTDGSTWTTARAQGEFNFSGVAAANGIFAAVSGADVETSADGVHWTIRPMPRGVNNLRGIAFTGNSFMAVGEFAVIVSSIH